MNTQPEPIACSSGCKNTQPSAEAATAAGWERLPITGRWRCPECWRELLGVNKPAPLNP